MKKFLYLAMCLLLTASIVLCFVACGGNGDTSGTSSQPNVPSSSVDSGSVSSTPTGSVPSTDGSKPDTPSSGTTGSSTPGTDGSGSADSTTPGTGSSDTTGSSTPGTGSSDTTGSSTPGTGSSDTTSSSTQQPPVDTPHEHTYSDKYSYDSENHYYESTCEHKGEKTGVEPHTIDKNTGNCVCGYHEHVYSETYSYNAETHYFEAICGCEYAEHKGVEAHSYNESNECKCGQVKDVVQEMIATIIANKNAITNGTSTQVSNNKEFSAVSQTKVTYIFYDDYVYVKEEGDYINEYYYSFDNDKLVAIFVQNGGSINVDTEASIDNLEGAKYNFGCIGDYETYVCGAEKLVEYFYNYGVANAKDSFVISNNENTYSFSYVFCVIDDWMNAAYKVNVSFTVDETTKALVSVNINADRYSQESYTVVDGVCVLNAGAVSNYETTITVTQSTAANENVENPYNSSKILLDSFVIRDRDGNDIEEVVVKLRVDETVKIFLSDLVPSTALLELCNIEIIVKNSVDGSIVDITPFYNSYDKSYSFNMKAPGTYDLAVSIDGVTVNSTLEIAPSIPETIAAQVYNASLGEFDKVKKAEVYAGSSLYFMSFVDSGFDGSYVASVIGENAANATITAGEIGGKAVSVFSSNTVGEYIVEIKSSIRETVSCQLKVVVNEAPSIESLLVGEYFKNGENGEKIVSAIFDNGTVEVVYAGVYGEEYTTLSYSVENGTINFEWADGDEFVEAFYVNDQFQVVMVIYEEEYVLEQVYVERVLVGSGTMSVQDIAGNGAKSNNYAFELYSTGEFVFYKDYSMTKEVVLTGKDGAYNFKFAGQNAQALTKTSGETGVLAGEYQIENTVKIIITVDETATAVKEPAYGTIEVVDHASSNSGKNFSFTYAYEINGDGEFVIYRYNEVTEEVTLIDLGGEYSFNYPGLSSSKTLEKIEGGDDVLGGTYVIDMNLGMVVRIAEVIIVPGAAAPENPALSEKSYGTFILDDNNGGELGGTYTYEIVDGAFVIYKDGVVTNDIIITNNLDGTYSFQCVDCVIPQVLNKINGLEGALQGYYEVQTDIEVIYGITFMPGVLDEEKSTGTLVIVDNNKGTFSGTYSYEIAEGVFVFYKEDGTQITNEFYVTIGLDGATYTFQCLDFMIPQSLIKVEGISVLLGGKYQVNGENGVAYEFVFTPGAEIEREPVYVEQGTLEITDNNSQTVGGSYTYKITEDGAIVVFKDGEKTNDVIISVGLDGNYTFQCMGLLLPQTLIKVRGENGMLSGKYNVVNDTTVTYSLVFLKEGYELPGQTTQELVLGENTINVNDAENGVIVTYTASTSGELSLTKGDDSKVAIYVVAGSNKVLVKLPTKMTFNAGESVKFLILTTDGTIGTVDFSSSFTEKIIPDLGIDEF